MDETITTYSYTGTTQTWSSNSVGNGNRYYLNEDGQYYQVYGYQGRIWIYIDGWYYLSDAGLSTTDPGYGATFSGTLYTRNSTTQSKMAALRSAVGTFIDVIKDNDPGIEGKHNQISIVKFACDDYYDDDPESSEATGNNRNAYSSYVGGRRSNYNYSEIVTGFTPVFDDASATSLKSVVNQLEAGGATASDYGMTKALALINSLYSEGKPIRQSNKTVVFFTDGVPTYGERYDKAVAEAAIQAAATIKNKVAYTDTDVTPNKDYNVTVFSVGVFGSMNNTGMTAGQRDTYMERISSNYPEASGMDNGEAGTANSKTTYYQDASSGNLEDIFRSIANEAGGNTSINSSAIAAVDVVSQSFNIPDGAGNIVFYEAPVINVAEDGTLTFAPKSSWIPNPPGVTVGQDNTDPHKVTATGFDYAAKYCGKQKVIVDGVETGYRPHGSKLVIEIQITMAEDAVGGPKVDTNGPGSGIYVEGKNECSFDSPTVDLPVNLQIKKVNMQVGESSKFMIQKTSTSGGTPSASSSWTDVSSVFVTKTSSSEEPSVYIRGLDPHFYYRILEEGWGWSYNFVNASGAAYVPDKDDVDDDEDTEELIMGTRIVTNKNEVTSDKFVSNPITFDNEKKANIESNLHHAESKATNTFNGSDPVFVDSKKGNGTGRITP